MEPGKYCMNCGRFVPVGGMCHYCHCDQRRLYDPSGTDWNGIN